MLGLSLIDVSKKDPAKDSPITITPLEFDAFQIIDKSIILFSKLIKHTHWELFAIISFYCNSVTIESNDYNIVTHLPLTNDRS